MCTEKGLLIDTQVLSVPGQKVQCFLLIACVLTKFSILKTYIPNKTCGMNT